MRCKLVSIFFFFFFFFFTWYRGLPTMEGNTARGASSPANPALHIPEPLSITRAATSSSPISEYYIPDAEIISQQLLSRFSEIYSELSRSRRTNRSWGLDSGDSKKTRCYSVLAWHWLPEHCASSWKEELLYIRAPLLSRHRSATTHIRVFLQRPRKWCISKSA